MQLSAFRYTIIHISGEDNVWADLLSRWAVPKDSLAKTTHHKSALLQAPIAPDLDPDFTWPSFEDIKRSQDTEISNGEESSTGMQGSNGLICDNSDF